MSAGLDPFNAIIPIEPVSALHARKKALDIPGYYEEGEVNPFAQRCKIVPKKARWYVMIPVEQSAKLKEARLMLKAMSGHRKVTEVKATRDAVSYEGFAETGEVVVLYT